MERDLIERATLLNTREEYVAWEQRCDEFIESLEEQSRIKRPRLSIGNRQSVIACIARFESLKSSVRGRFVHIDIAYYVQCSYDSSLSGYRFRRDKDCIAWFTEELKNLAHSVQTTISANVPMADFTRDDWEKFNSASHCHVCLPFCPTREKPQGKRDDKLLATLCDKQRYVIHYRNLQQCTRHGLRIAKIHRILQFTQSPWLRDYIELNTKFRTLAKNDFEKNLYKLINNAVFGKTMENVRDRVDVKLLTKWEDRYGAEAMIAKPHFHSRSVFSENLVAI
ncbi:hypothetical protein ALC57_06439 [Trachymyrmex cornetzi]|uniref:DNA-directed DNA polymerase n=1 Tax=Trachymyrmex cornetzi TaxID=471704 RepID=A0A151J8K6_9HYME|nr:hypothetical protein ALC57_06439 [Trachymyrmex cornetzi]